MRLLVHDVVEMPDVWMRDEKRVVWTREDEELAERMRRRVVCEEEGWMAFDKPAGVAVQGGSGVQTHIARILPLLAGENGVWRTVHRLDRETSGVLVVGKTLEATAAWAELFRQPGAIRKEYTALVSMPLDKHLPDSFIVEDRIVRTPTKSYVVHKDSVKGKSATTEVQLVKAWRDHHVAWLHVYPHTGRKHQIRLHCAQSLHTPILGDTKYNMPSTCGLQLALTRLDTVHAPWRLMLSRHSKAVPSPSKPRFQRIYGVSSRLFLLTRLLVVLNAFRLFFQQCVHVFVASGTHLDVLHSHCRASGVPTQHCWIVARTYLQNCSTSLPMISTLVT